MNVLHACAGLCCVEVASAARDRSSELKIQMEAKPGEPSVMSAASMGRD